MYRRPALAILDACYKCLPAIAEDSKVFALPASAASELLGLSILAPFLVTDC